jgi:hypothetical protein
MGDDVTGDFNRTPPESSLDPMLAEVQADGLVVPYSSGESVLTAFADAIEEEDDVGQFVGVTASGEAEDNDGDVLSWDGMTAALVLDELAFDTDSPDIDSAGYWQGDGTVKVPAGTDGTYRIDAQLAISAADYSNVDLASVGVDILVNGQSVATDNRFFDPTNLGPRENNPATSVVVALHAEDVVSIRATAYTINPNPPGGGYPIDFTCYVGTFAMARLGQ